MRHVNVMPWWPLDNESRLAKQIVRLMQDGGLRARLAAEGRVHVREWHADALALNLAVTDQDVVAAYQASRAVSRPA